MKVVSFKKCFSVFIVLAILFFACAACLSACGKETASANPYPNYITAVYAKYVSQSLSVGDEVLSYEDWLNSIKGDSGENGKSAYELYLETLKEGEIALTEDEWLTSLSGVSISQVKLSEDGKYIIFCFTDGKTEKVKIPFPSNSHTHSFGELITVLPPRFFREGLGYKVCSFDGYKELEVIPALGYIIKAVFRDGGAAVADVLITVNGETVKTDSEGYAVFKNTVRGEYNVQAEAKGYIFSDKLVTDGRGEYVITLDAAPKVLHTFKIVDEDNLPVGEGITLSAVCGGETVAFGQTDVGGNVTLNLLPDEYEIRLDFGGRADEFEAFIPINANIGSSGNQTIITVVKSLRDTANEVEFDQNNSAVLQILSENDVFNFKNSVADPLYVFGVTCGYIAQLTVTDANGGKIFIVENGVITEDANLYLMHLGEEDCPSVGSDKIAELSVSGLSQNCTVEFSVFKNGADSVIMEIKFEI